jgi:HEAT repeat protein
LKQVLQANIYEDDMAPFFARILASTNQSIREGAVVQLGGFRSAVALTALEVALHDEDPQVRQYALGPVCQHVHVCGQTPLKDLAQRQNIPPIANAYRQWLNASAKSE